MKKLLIIICLISTFVARSGEEKQFDTKNSFWTEFNFIQPINKKFSGQLDFQYRTQSDQEFYQTDPNLTNIFLHPQQMVFRPWINYKLNKKVKLSFSPIGYWVSFGLSGSPGVKSPSGVEPNSMFLRTPEYRVILQTILYDRIGRVKLQQRYRYEFRWASRSESLETPDNILTGNFSLSPGDLLNDTKHKQRFRYALKGAIALKGQTIDRNEFFIPFSSEVLLGVSSIVKPSNMLDQNRSSIGIGYKTKNGITLQLAYLKQIKSGKSIGDVFHFDDNNVLYVGVKFSDLGSLLKKKPN